MYVRSAKNLESLNLAIHYPVSVSRLFLQNFAFSYNDIKLNSYKQCSQCGKLIKIKGKNNKYCDKCSKEKELEKYKKYNDKR